MENENQETIHPETNESPVSSSNPNPSGNLSLAVALTYVSQKALRRLAAVGLTVVDRHRADSPMIEASAKQFVPVAESFIDTYDKSRVKGPHRQREAAELAAAIEPLRKSVQGWVGTMIIALDKFDASAFANRERSPQGNIDDAKRLIEVVHDAQKSGNPLDFAQTLESELTPLIARAEKELSDVADLASTTAQKQQRVRELALALQRDLVGLRRCLKATLGAKHPDYRRLILRGGKKTTDDDVEVIPETDDLEATDAVNSDPSVDVKEETG